MLRNESKPRIGGWITTHSGKRFYPLDARAEEIDINDIAHALSNIARFGGHTDSFYSVAQHSVLVSLMVPPEDALWGLLHDATEAYLVDVPSPLKKCPEFIFYRQAEARMMAVICGVFSLSSDEPPSVKLADRRMLVTEARDLTITEGRGCSVDAWPYDFNIKAWQPHYARARFNARFHELTTKKAA